MQLLSVAVEPDEHTIGPADAPVTLVEYGRYDCPQCKRVPEILEQLRERYDAPLRFVYRHFPREATHSPSVRAAEAAEAAGRQGRFWEMHDHLLDNQHALDDADLLAHAALLGLDMRQFAHDMEHHTHEHRVLAHLQGGVESGVHGTPTFFINGVRHEDFWDPDTLLTAIEAVAPATLSEDLLSVG